MCWALERQKANEEKLIYKAAEFGPRKKKKFEIIKLKLK